MMAKEHRGNVHEWRALTKEEIATHTGDIWLENIQGHMFRCRWSGAFQPRPKAGDWYRPCKWGLRDSHRVTASNNAYVKVGVETRPELASARMQNARIEAANKAYDAIYGHGD